MKKSDDFFLFKNIDAKVNVISSIPLYYQVYDILKKTINENDILLNTPLPSEEKLAKYFKVSRPTISRAIAELVKNSIISKRKGGRAYLKNKHVNLLFLNELVSFGKDLNSLNIPHSTKILKAEEIKADEKLAKLLGLKSNSKIYLIVRLRYIKDEPVIIVKSYLPKKYFPNLPKQDFETRDLYEILSSEYGIYIKKGERKIEAIKCSEEESQFFQIPIGDPVLHLESVVTSADGRKIEYFDSKLNGEKVALFTTVFPPQEKLEI